MWNLYLTNSTQQPTQRSTALWGCYGFLYTKCLWTKMMGCLIISILLCVSMMMIVPICRDHSTTLYKRVVMYNVHKTFVEVANYSRYCGVQR